MDSKLETPRTEVAWNKEQTTEYIKAILRGPNFRLLHREYPQSIDLTETDHLIDEAWWKTSQDPRKREAINLLMLGLDNQFYSFSTASISQTGSITENLILDQIIKAREKANLNHGLMFMHSHPPNRNEPSFSVGDMHFLLTTYLYIPVFIAAESKYNLVAFSARDSKPSKSIEGVGLNREQFTKYWYEENGWIYHNTDITGEHASPIDNSKPSSWEIIKKIAASHQLALYKGENVGPLKREA